MNKIAIATLVICLHSVASAQSPAKDASKSLVTRFWSEVWNTPYRMETIDELTSEDFTITTDGKDIKGRADFKKWVQGFQAKIGDLKVVPQELLVTDDGQRVITRMVVTGRNKGMFGTTPDNAPVKFVAISIVEVKDGKLVHNWVERSAYELQQRLTSKKKSKLKPNKRE
jgi:predicted ester cyclase